MTHEMIKSGDAMAGKTCLVTGAAGGLGLATALGLTRMGATVLMVARDRASGEAAIAEIGARSTQGSVELFIADLSSQRQVRRLATEVIERHPTLDVLVNNAASVFAERRLSEDGIEMTVATNHLAPFLLTTLLAEPLAKAPSSRVVNVSSYLHRSVRAIPWDDLQGERRYTSHGEYNLTKLMNVLFTYELAKRLAGSGVTANCLHPGWPLKTRLGRDEHGIARIFDRLSKLVGKSAEEGARTALFLASSADVAGVSGGYFMNCKPAESSSLSHDGPAAARLWDLSSTLCHLPEIGATADGRDRSMLSSRSEARQSNSATSVPPQ
jgi:NAD(P)-dependent dehydrogenase (short-subunit alcohol dehydrogenase family)